MKLDYDDQKLLYHKLMAIFGELDKTNFGKIADQLKSASTQSYDGYFESKWRSITNPHPSNTIDDLSDQIFLAKNLIHETKAILLARNKGIPEEKEIQYAINKIDQIETSFREKERSLQDSEIVLYLKQIDENQKLFVKKFNQFSAEQKTIQDSLGNTISELNNLKKAVNFLPSHSYSSDLSTIATKIENLVTNVDELQKQVSEVKEAITVRKEEKKGFITVFGHK